MSAPLIYEESQLNESDISEVLVKDHIVDDEDNILNQVHGVSNSVVSDILQDEIFRVMKDSILDRNVKR